ncbi:hypothetical protein, partial [Mycobacterium gordonae]|uniref:hypothetical protein n=1 Tax=Mycobacterium gordonae TaxID=1778 RepID=UPI001C49F518
PHAGHRDYVTPFTAEDSPPLTSENHNSGPAEPRSLGVGVPLRVRLSRPPARHDIASGVFGDTLTFGHLIDETKHADYLVVAAVVVAGDLGAI